MRLKRILRLTFISAKRWNSLTGYLAISGRISILRGQFRPKRSAQGFALLASPALRDNSGRIVGHRGVLVIDSGIMTQWSVRSRRAFQHLLRSHWYIWLLNSLNPKWSEHKSLHFDGPMELERGRCPKRSFASRRTNFSPHGLPRDTEDYQVSL
jgi:hypothetical protein